MKQVAILLSICILIIIRPAAGWSANNWLVEELGILLKSATFYIGIPEKSGAMAYLKIPEGTIVRILEAEGAYYRINHKDLIGYVEQKLVKKVPPAAETAKESPTVGNVPPPQKPVPDKSPEPTVAKKSVSASYLVTEKTSLRADPDSEAEVLLRLPVDGKVIVLDNTGKYWWKASYNGKTGWVKCALLRKE